MVCEVTLPLHQEVLDQERPGDPKALQCLPAWVHITALARVAVCPRSGYLAFL